MRNIYLVSIFIIFIIFFFLASQIYAEILWQFDSNDAITVKPSINFNIIYFPAQNGNFYAVSGTTGKILWKLKLDNYMLAPIIDFNNIIVANNKGIITKLNKDGTIDSQINATKSANVTAIYGISGSQASKIYLTTDKGIVTIEENDIVPFFNYGQNIMYTAPTLISSKIIFGVNSELIVLNSNKQIEWKKKIANFWISKPVVENSIVYMGSTDNSIYAFDLLTGDLRWRYETNGWVTGIPIVKDGITYVGSNDGYLYALDGFDGSLKWKTKTDAGIQTEPIIASFGGKDIVAVGSNDGNLYIINQQTGKVIWKFLTGDWVTSPILAGNNIIIGSRNGLLYNLKTDRGCTINEPKEKSTVGQKEVKIKGTVASSFDIKGVSIRINDGDWKNTNTINDGWQINIDPVEMKNGPNKIYCKVNDGNGEESEPYYFMILIKAANIKKSNFIISAPKTVDINKEFRIFVNDGDDNSPIENFEIKYGTEDKKATGNITLNISTGGIFKADIMKTGFENAHIEINIKAPNTIADLAFPIIIGLVILALIYFLVIRRFLKR